MLLILIFITYTYVFNNFSTSVFNRGKICQFEIRKSRRFLRVNLVGLFEVITKATSLVIGRQLPHLPCFFIKQPLIILKLIHFLNIHYHDIILVL